MQKFAAGAVRKAMTGIIKPENARKMTPKLGSKGLLAFVVVAALFLGIIETSRHTGANTPLWYKSVIAKIVK